MKIRHSSGKFSLLRLAVLALTLLPALACAQDPFPTPTPTPDPLAGVPVQVLDQQQVTYGTHTITFNRIAPPVFPAATPTPVPQATPTTPTTNRAVRTVSAARTAGNPRQDRSRRTTRSAQGDGGSGEDRPSQVLALSATVYDHQFTALRWYDGSAPGLQAYVNVDFNYFSVVPTLETATKVYELIFGLGNDTASSLTQAGQPLPDFSAVPAGHAGYQIVAGDPSACPEAIAALDALCAYYDANGAQMVAAYNQQQANNAAYQQWLAAHPPVRPNTVINYWPIKSRVYPPSGK